MTLLSTCFKNHNTPESVKKLIRIRLQRYLVAGGGNAHLAAINGMIAEAEARRAMIVGQIEAAGGIVPDNTVNPDDKTTTKGEHHERGGIGGSFKRRKVRKVNSDVGEHSQGTHEGVEAEGISTTDGNELPANRDSQGGKKGSQRNKGAKGGRVSESRSGGSGDAEVHPSSAGTGSDRGDGAGRVELESTAIPAINFVITEDVQLGKGGETVKFNDNIAAIRLVKQLDRERRRATPAEQKVLARYVGWGGLANAFENAITGEVSEKWKDKAALVKELLTPEEYAVARNSTKAAHYTSQTVVSAIWEAVHHLGYRGGNVLEPSVGSGNFIGLIPDDLAGRSNVLGVEYDNITAAIAKNLYPQSAIIHSGFENIPLPSNAFDLAIGNPPFGDSSLSFKYVPDANSFSIHNQFFLASMEALKPGGIQAMVVSRYLLDAVDGSARRQLARSGKLLGAIRLPDTAFKENAKTEVVTDIVFLQKFTKEELFEREKAAEAAGPEVELPSWVRTTTIPDPLGGDPMTVNSYFAENPKAIIGKMDRSGSMRHGADITVSYKGDFSKDLMAAVEDILPKDVAKQAPVGGKSLEQFQIMRAGIEISMAGLEDGSVFADDIGALAQIVVREVEGGDQVLTRRAVTKDSVWSPNLLMDKDGKWFREVDKKGPDGKPVKAVVNGKATKRNVKEREVFEDESKIHTSLKLGAKGLEILKGAVELRDLMLKQIALEIGDEKDNVVEAHRVKLNVVYDEFVRDHGDLHSSKVAGVFSGMPDEALILSYEQKYRPPIDKAKAEKLGVPVRESQAVKADILSKRVKYPYALPDRASSPADALALTLAEKGYLDLGVVGSLLGKTEEEVVASLHDEMDEPLIFLDPETMTWETRDEYLTGNVVRKLEAAKESGYEKNIEGLSKVQPEPWTADKITATIGGTWIPGTVYADFVQHLTENPASVSFSKLTNSFSVKGRVSGRDFQWGTPDMSSLDIVDHVLNDSPIRITRTVDKKVVTDHEATILATQKAEEIKQEFDSWVFRDADRRKQLVDLFNKKYNVRVAKQRSGSHLVLPGKVPDALIKMRRHQMNAIWRGVVDRFTLYDHAVGAGKTYTAIARAMERRRMGLSRKPMIAVPNHLVPQFSADVLRLYPGAKLLAARKKDTEPKNRRRFFAKIATGDWDVVILPHSSFGFIGISPLTEERYLAEELKIAEAALKEAEEAAIEDNGGQEPRFKSLGVKAAENMIDKIKARLKALSERGAQKDKLLTFEQLGVDDLTIDEAHEFKNLFYHSRLDNVRGLNPKAGSQKAYDLWTKVRVLRESGTGSVAFLTGTPISNSAVEMYTLMRYLAADDLAEMGIEHFDAWRSQFVSVSSQFEHTETNSLKEVNRLGRDWTNMRSLMDLYYTFSDSVSNEDIMKWYAEDNNGKPFPIPQAKGGGRVGVNVSPTPAQKAALTRIIGGFEGLPDIKDPKQRNAERLRLMDQARKVSLDVRAVNPLSDSDEKGGKLEAVSNEVFRIYKQWNGDKGTQLLFCDRSVPKAKGDDAKLKKFDDLLEKLAKAEEEGAENLPKLIEQLDAFDRNEMASLRAAAAGGWNAYGQIKKNLIALGIPANEIAFVQDADTDEKKKELFDSVNSGAVRVLIGSTPRMGAGTNVQERLVALHHVDVTWKPSDIEQREGRIIRQGNKLLEKFGNPFERNVLDEAYGAGFEVEILAYTTDTTIDAKLWNLNSTKLKMINGIRHYSGDFTMEFDDEESVSMAEIAAIASGDPLMLERVKLASEIDKLVRLRSAHNRRQWAVKDELAQSKRKVHETPGIIKALGSTRDTYKSAMAAFEEQMQARKVVIDGETLAGGQLEEAILLINNLRPEGKKGKFKATIDGNEFTNVEKAKEYVRNALGDMEYPLEVDGVKFYRQSEGLAAIAKLANNTGEEGGRLAAPIKVYGLDAEIWFEPGEAKVSKSGNKSKTSETDRQPVAYYYELKSGGNVVYRDRYQGTSDPGGAAHERMPTLFKGVQSWVGNIGPQIAWHKNSLAAAKEAIPELEVQADAPFKQEDDLAVKRDRLKDVEGSLSSRAPHHNQQQQQPAAGDDAKLSVSSLPVDQAARIEDELRASGIGSLLDSGEVAIITHEEAQWALSNKGKAGAQVKYSKNGRIQGIVLNDRVYLVQGGIRQGQAKSVVLHEAGVHVGQAMATDVEFKAVLRSIELRRNEQSETGKAIREAFARVPEGTEAGHVTEEALAYLVEAHPEVSMVRRVIALVKRFLVKLKVSPNIFTAADLRALAEVAVRMKVVEAENKLLANDADLIENGGEFAEENDTRYSVADDSPLSTDNLQETVSVQGSIKVLKNKKIDSTFLDRIFSTPEYYFKKFAAAGRVLQAALNRRDIRFVKEKEILNGRDKDGNINKEGFVTHVQELRKNNKEAYEEANNYLLHTDQGADGFRIKSTDDGEWKVIAPGWAVEDGNSEIGVYTDEGEAVKAMIDAEGEAMDKKRYSQEAIQAVKMARELTNRGFDIMATDMRRIIAEAKENGLPDPFIGDGKVDEAGRYGIYAAGKKQPIGLFASQEEAVQFLENAKKMISYMVIGSRKGERGFATELQANRWAAKHSGTVKGQPMFLNLVVKKRTDAEMRPLTIKQALAQMGDLRGIFFPRIREAGEYVLIAKKNGENPIRKHFDIPTVGDDRPALQKVMAMATPMGREARRLKSLGYDVTIKKDDSPSEDIFDATNLVSSLDAIMQDSMRTIDKNNQSDVKAGQHINQILTMQIADIFKSRGYLSSRLKRLAGDVVWEGYEEDMGRALTQYGKNVAAGTAKRDTARAMILAFSGRDYSWAEYKQEVEKPDWVEYQEIVEKRRIDPRTQKNLFRDVRSFMVDVLRNDDQVDRIMGVMKGLAVLKYLGFRVSSATVNLTNMVQGVPATLAGHTGESIHKALGRVTAAAVAYGKYRSGKGNLDAADRAIFQNISEKGWDEAQFNYEAAKELRSKVGEAWNTFMTASMYMFGATEKANRAMTLFAAYKTVKEQNPTADKSVVWEKAKEISDRAHGNYGKETLPAWARGKLNPLRLTYTFQKFSHNYMLNMIDLGYTRKEYKAAAYMLLSPAILAGAGASLAGPVLFAAAGALGMGGDDPEEEWYKKMEELFGAGEFARHGLFGMAGINIKGSLAMNLPMPADIGKAKVTDLAGPAGGVLTDTGKGLAHLFKGELAKGVELLLPTAFGSMSKAAREATEGVTTSNYGTVFYGDEPLRADAMDAFLRFLSFNPARLSGIREQQWNERTVAERYQEEKKAVYANIKRLHLQGKGLTPEILKAIKVYNDRVSESGRQDLTPITPKGVKTMLHRDGTASKLERTRVVR